ncbi:MAG: glycosyltransferase family 32 protein [Clostridia bacterium]
MAIPKKIHYVWMGGKEKPKAIKRCMQTWKKYLSDYEIIEWNEDNFDINSHPFVKNAYKNKKWAFVSDYVRAYAIYNYGGIYLDTDVLVIDRLDSLLENKAFVGYENDDHPFTAVFGAEKGHPLIKDMLEYYDELNIGFDFEDNNTISVSKLLIDKYRCKTGNIEQVLETGIKVYKDGVLCNPSEESLTVHVFLGSWLGGSKVHEMLRLRLSNKFRIKLYCLYKRIKNKIKGRK